MSREKFIIIALSVIAGITIFLWFLFDFSQSSLSKKTYSVVYLSSGEIYIGRLQRFPRWKLSDAYIFQSAKNSDDPAKNTFQLVPLKDALWAPKEIYLERDQIIFSGPLDENSRAAQALKQAR